MHYILSNPSLTFACIMAVLLLLLLLLLHVAGKGVARSRVVSWW